jgi:hypothetical protein
VIRIASMSLVIFLLLITHYVANASPNYPFEGLLPRAETIFIGRKTNHSEKDFTLEIIETLRGHTEQTTLTFGFSSHDDSGLSAAGSSYLVISQGDTHFGNSAAIVSFGQVLKGQAGYCGWIAFPIKRDRGLTYLDLIHTRVGQKRGEKPARLTLNRARALIQQIPYKPDSHCKGV